MFETIYGHRLSGIGGPTLREPRSGLGGFGGRPSLHPAWRDENTRESDARVITVPAYPERQDERPAQRVFPIRGSRM